MTYEPRCDRCGRKPPFETQFWSVRGGIVCDSCNAEWAVFMDFWQDAAMCWGGHTVLLTTRRHLSSLERQLAGLRKKLV